MTAQEMAALIFAGADKSSMDNFAKDATAFGSVVNNRLMRPNRFGEYGTPKFNNDWYEFGSNEYNKFVTGNLTEKEQEYAKKALQISNGILTGRIKDPTGGADHIYNPKTDGPNAWNVRWKESDTKVGEMFYPETHKTKAHVYRKETLRRRKTKKQ